MSFSAALVVVGEATYEMFSPLYDKIRIKNGESTVSIKTKGRRSPDDIIRGIYVNGRPMDGYRISQGDLSGKSRIVIEYWSLEKMTKKVSDMWKKHYIPVFDTLIL